MTKQEYILFALNHFTGLMTIVGCVLILLLATYMYRYGVPSFNIAQGFH